MARHETAPRVLLARAAATGVVTALVPPSRLPRSVRRGLHLTLGLSAATAAEWTAAGRPTPATPEAGQSQKEPVALRLPARLALAGAVGTLTGLCSAAGTGLDAATERALVRRGVRQPRVWMGLVAAGLTLAVAWGAAVLDGDTSDTGAEGGPAGL